MKHRYWLNGIVSILLVLFAVSCEKNDPVPDDDGNNNQQTVSNEILVINNWIQENMNALYLWNDYIPENLNPKTEENPSEFFYKMVYNSEDRWSWITDDLDALINDLQGTPVSFGYYPSFFANSANDVFISIQYVYEGSPAADAGLSRGDIIYSINGQVMDTDNYSDIYYEDQTNHSYIMGKVEFGQILPTQDTVQLTARQIDADPALHHEVLDLDGIKTGYLAYAEFISGVDDKYLSKLDDVFSGFNAEGITELIVDFRYNPGGEINTAAYLASGIVPKTNMESKDELVLYQYNEGLQNYYTQQGQTDRLKKTFVNNAYNLGISRVYFLTTQRTASASELVITGLEPYMDVIVIGEVTVGKYTGAWVIPDQEDPPRHSYAMIPIVLKYANADGLTEFKDGLMPDHEIDYNPINVYNFGDTDDPMTQKAVELITGVSARKKAVTELPEVRILKDKRKLWKENAFERIVTERSFTPEIIN